VAGIRQPRCSLPATTFGSYGKLTPDQQRDLVRNVGKRKDENGATLDKILAAVRARNEAA
jgi:hypothetical protein